jgi:hypothetical protein
VPSGPRPSRHGYSRAESTWLRAAPTQVISTPTLSMKKLSEDFAETKGGQWRLGTFFIISPEPIPYRKKAEVIMKVAVLGSGMVGKAHEAALRHRYEFLIAGHGKPCSDHFVKTMANTMTTALRQAWQSIGEQRRHQGHPRAALRPGAVPLVHQATAGDPSGALG